MRGETAWRIEAHSPPRQRIAERPAGASVVQKDPIDPRSSADLPVDDARRARPVELEKGMHDLQEDDARAGSATDAWADAPLAAIIGHVVAVHHQYLKRELPSIEFLLGRMADAHGAQSPELVDLRALFADYRAMAEAHMEREEAALFPLIVRLEQDAEPGELKRKLIEMEREHAEAAETLARMWDLTNGYEVPTGGGNTGRVLMDGLAAMSADMREHMRLENEILFPRAARLDAERSRPA